GGSGPGHAAGVGQADAVPDVLGLVGASLVRAGILLLLVQRVTDLPIVYVLVGRFAGEQREVPALVLAQRDALLLVEEELLARLAFLGRGRVAGELFLARDVAHQ